jgi:hypothetical protein
MSARRSTTTKNRVDALSHYSLPNLQAVLDLATEADWAAGLSWYVRAHENAVLLSTRYGISTEQAAGIIAALSPQNGWENNLTAADLFLTDPSVDVHFHDACQKARAILSGADPLSALRGQKVRSFYRNIVEPTRNGAVTIDRHAAAILCGLPTPEWNRRFQKTLERRHFYRLATGVYRAEARRLGLLPHQVQAVAWLVQSNRSTDTKDYGDF